MSEVFIDITYVSQEKNIFHTHGGIKHLNLNIKKANLHEYFKKITLFHDDFEEKKIFHPQVLHKKKEKTQIKSKINKSHHKFIIISNNSKNINLSNYFP